MNNLDNNTCDAVSLRLCGLIGLFDLLVDVSVKQNENVTMTDFAFYIAQELKGLHKTLTGVEYGK
jgi:hypothetical protein